MTQVTRILYNNEDVTNLHSGLSFTEMMFRIQEDAKIPLGVRCIGEATIEITKDLIYPLFEMEKSDVEYKSSMYFYGNRIPLARVIQAVSTSSKVDTECRLCVLNGNTGFVKVVYDCPNGGLVNFHGNNSWAAKVMLSEYRIGNVNGSQLFEREIRGKTYLLPYFGKSSSEPVPILKIAHGVVEGGISVMVTKGFNKWVTDWFQYSEISLWRCGGKKVGDLRGVVEFMLTKHYDSEIDFNSLAFCYSDGEILCFLKTNAPKVALQHPSFFVNKDTVNYVSTITDKGVCLTTNEYTNSFVALFPNEMQKTLPKMYSKKTIEEGGSTFKDVLTYMNVEFCTDYRNFFGNKFPLVNISRARPMEKAPLSISLEQLREDIKVLKHSL